MRLTPASSAASTTASVPSCLTVTVPVRPKLLPPRPTADTRRPDPRLRWCMPITLLLAPPPSLIAASGGQSDSGPASNPCRGDAEGRVRDADAAAQPGGPRRHAGARPDVDDHRLPPLRRP